MTSHERRVDLNATGGPDRLKVRKARDHESPVALTRAPDGRNGRRDHLSSRVRTLFRTRRFKHKFMKTKAKAKSAKSDEPETRIKILKFKVIRPDKEVRDRWMTLAKDAQRVYNTIFRTWFVWHVNNGSPSLVHTYLKDARAWYAAQNAADLAHQSALAAWNQNGKKGRKPVKTTLPPKPECPVRCFPKGLTNTIRAECMLNRGKIAGRTLDLMLQKETSDFCGRRATKSNFPRWMIILGDEGEYQSASKPMPIRFDARNSNISKNNDIYTLCLSITSTGEKVGS